MAAQFGDLTNATGLQKLNEFLSTRSYITGYTPSHDDIDVSSKLRLADIDAVQYPHVRRWFSHILNLDDYIVHNISQSTTTESAGGEYHLDVSDDESDFNLSDDDEDDEAAALIKKRKEEALAKVLAKAANKPKARSSIIWDVKPEDDETDMTQLEKDVRAINMTGLEWQGSELVPVAYGISKLRIISQIVDEDVPTDDLQEAIEGITGVQSTDIFAFNKV